MSLITRIKNWKQWETVLNSDLNAEFNNIIQKLVPNFVQDWSDTLTQMRDTFNPGNVSSENQPTSLAEELKALRFMVGAITGGAQWYVPPVSTITELRSLVGGSAGIPAYRLDSGRVDANNQPMFLVPEGSSNRINLKATATNFRAYFNDVSVTVTADKFLTGLSLAPGTANTCLVNNGAAAAQEDTKFLGEDGTAIDIDTIGSNISALNGRFAAFKVGTEYFIAKVDTGTNQLVQAYRGYFFNNSDVNAARETISNNDTITLMKLTWVFAVYDSGTGDVTLAVCYNQPFFQSDQPSSPAVNDYWFDLDAQVWKQYNGSSWDTVEVNLLGVCCQDSSNTVAARSFDFFKVFSELNNMELEKVDAATVRAKQPNNRVSVYGTTYRYEYNQLQWDMPGDLDTGSEASSTRYYLYITDLGVEQISATKPYNREPDMLGYYHPAKPWRCVGYVDNDGSSDFTDGSVNWHLFNTNPTKASTGAFEIGEGKIDYLDRDPQPGWMKAQGQELSRITYAKLFQDMGTTWGVGNGTTTFNIPDMSGRKAVGAGTGPASYQGDSNPTLTARAVGDAWGRETHALSIAELAAHDHGTSTQLHIADFDSDITSGDNSVGHTHSITGSTEGGGSGGSNSNFLNAPTGSGSGNTGPNSVVHQHDIAAADLNSAQSSGHGHTINTDGSGSAHNNTDPSAGVNYLIRVA